MVVHYLGPFVNTRCPQPQGTSLLGCKWLKKFPKDGGKPSLVAQDEGGGAQFGVALAPPDQHEAAQEREVRGGVAGAGAGFVLEPGGVAGVMIFVFDAPAAARGAQGVFRGEGFAQDKHAAAGAGLAGGFLQAVAFDFEELLGVDEAEGFGRDGKRADVALVEPPVTGFEGGGKKGGAACASKVSARVATVG